MLKRKASGNSATSPRKVGPMTNLIRWQNNTSLSRTPTSSLTGLTGNWCSCQKSRGYHFVLTDVNI